MRLNVIFMGSPEFAVPTLLALHREFRLLAVVTQEDKPKGRGRKPSSTSVKTTAQELNVKVLQPKSLRDSTFQEIVRGLEPDVVVVAAYGKFLPSEFLAIPKLGCVNLHASLLPKYRGASPIQAAILSGDKETGVTTIIMDEGMDSGPILLNETIPISDTDTTGSLHDRMAEPGAQLVVKTLRSLSENTITPVPQDPEKATYTELIRKESGFIDWKRGADYLERLVRAMNPWPMAFFFVNGEEVKLLSANSLPGNGNIGEIITLDKESISVGTGKGLLVLRDVKPSGKRMMNAAEFARGRRLEIGTKLSE